MKKELKVLGLLMLIAFICCGCDAMYASTTRDIRHSGFALSGAELKCDDLFKDTDYDKVRFLTGKHAILESGSVYELSIGQKYSNEQNCMASPLTSGVVALFDENVVKTHYVRLAIKSVNNKPVIPEEDNNSENSNESEKKDKETSNVKKTEHEKDNNHRWRSSPQYEHCSDASEVR